MVSMEYQCIMMGCTYISASRISVQLLTLFHNSQLPVSEVRDADAVEDVLDAKSGS